LAGANSTVIYATGAVIGDIQEDVRHGRAYLRDLAARR